MTQIRRAAKFVVMQICRVANFFARHKKLQEKAGPKIEPAFFMFLKPLHYH